MRIPLVEGWEDKVPKPRVYKLGKRDQDRVDYVHDQLHKRGCLRWTNQHTLTVSPVFVAR